MKKLLIILLATLLLACGNKNTLIKQYISGQDGELYLYHVYVTPAGDTITYNEAIPPDLEYYYTNNIPSFNEKLQSYE